MGLTINNNAAFHANAHATQRAARLLQNGTAKTRDASESDGGGDDSSARDGNRPAIDSQGEISVIHGCFHLL
jgi:hypothetical protein